MANYVGRRAALGIAVEATKGTVVAPTFWIPYNSLSFDDKAVVQVQESAFGVIADSDNTHITKRYGEGDVEANFYNKALGAILTAVLGASPSTAGGDPYTHTYTPSSTSNSHKSLSLYVQDPNKTTVFPGTMVNSLEMSIEPEGLVNWTVGFRSMKGRDWQRQTASYTSLGNKFLHQYLQFRVADTIGNLGAATNLRLRNLTFTIEKNVADWDDMGTVQPTDMLNRQMSVSGSIEIEYTDETWRNYFLDDTARAVEIYLYGSASNSLKIQMPNVQWQSWEPNKDINEIATQTLEFKAHYDAANAYDLIYTCILVNSQAGGSY